MNFGTMHTISEDLHSKNEDKIIVKKIIFDSTAQFIGTIQLSRIHSNYNYIRSYVFVQ